MSIGSTTYCKHDIIVKLPTDIVTDMVENGVHILPAPGVFFLRIPPRIRHIWVYEEDMEGITIMITLNRYTLPNRLYYITNPLYSEIMERRYHFPRNLIPSFAPRRIRRRFRGHLHHIW
jgi:hypothetical protein